LFISSSALCPYPYPREILVKAVGNFPWALAQSNRYLIGSAPTESTNIIGVVIVESTKAASRSKGGETMKR
jgi:hypothetical protein